MIRTVRPISWIRSRFGQRLLVLYVVCSLFPTVILGYLSYGAVSRQLERQGIERLRQTAQVVRDDILDRAALLASDLAELSDDPTPCLHRGSTAATDPACDGSLRYGFSALTFVPASGPARAVFGDLIPTAALADIVPDDLAPGQAAAFDLGPAETPRILMATATESRGLLVAEITAGYLWEAAERTPMLGSMAFHVVGDSLWTINQRDHDGRRFSPEQLGRSGRRGTTEWARDGEEMLAAFEPIGSSETVRALGWRVVVSDSRAAVFAPMEEFKEFFLIVALLGIGVAVILAASQIKESLEPLKALQIGTRRLAARNFDRPVEVKSDDEFAELATSFNAMAEQISRQFAAEKATAAIDRAILSSVETPEIVGAVLRGIREATRHERVAITLFDRAENGTTTWSFEPGGADPIGIHSMEAPAEFADGVEQLSVPIAEAPAWFPPDLLAGATELVVVPLRYQTRQIGTIGLPVPAGDDYVREGIPRAIGIARQAALALANARMVEQIRRLAFFDSLTGLPNRVSFKRRLSEELERIESGGKVAVFFLDLDHFSRINDTLGHKIGDRLVQEVGRRLEGCCRLHAPEASVARLGGDEFTVILPGPDDLLAASNLAEAILDDLREIFSLDGHETFVTTSIGIAVAPADGSDLESLLKNADSAMYQAKRMGRGRYAFYSTSLGASASKRLRLENHLRKALDGGEFEVWYQPIADIETGRVASAEALLRWKHPEWGHVSPDEFIPICEENGLIVPLGEWTMETVCRQIKEWEREGLPVVPVAVNMSSRQIHGSIVEVVQRILHTTQLAPRLLGFELTETVLMQGADDVLATLHGLADLGLTLAIDDFGTGYSSLSYLKQFPVHSVKIDRSFIREVIVNPDDAAITSAILAMGKALNLRIVAEGVEQLEQLELLRRMGCDLAQGYLAGRPAPAEGFARILRDRRPVVEVSRPSRPLALVQAAS